ncbi:hypothetical protein ACVPOY_06965 [Staphylococcus aureus]
MLPALTGNLIPNTKSNALIDAKNTDTKVYRVDNAMIYLKLLCESEPF